MSDINQEQINDRWKLMSHRLITRHLHKRPGSHREGARPAGFIRSLGDRHDGIDEWEHLLDQGSAAVRRLTTGRRL